MLNRARRCASAIIVATLLTSCVGDKATNPSAISVQAAGSVTVAAGQSSAPIIIAITRTNTTAEITLSLEGLPTGVTGTFSPSSLTGLSASATLTLVAASNVPAGSSTFTVRATGAGLTAQGSVSLTIQSPPDFTLSADSANLNMPSSSFSLMDVRIVRNPSFNGTVQLAVGPTPPNVNVALTGPAGATLGPGVTSTRLAVSVAPAATAGTYPITISATAPGVTAKIATVNVVVSRVAGAGYTIRLSPPLQAIVHNGAGNIGITVTRIPPFTGAVSLSAPTSNTAYTFALSRATIPANDSTAVLTVGTYVPAGSATPIFSLESWGPGVGPITSTFAIAAIPVPAKWLTLAALDTIRVAAGQSTTLDARIIRNPAFTSAITFSVPTALNGVTLSFTPNPNATANISVQIAVAASVAPGVYLVEWRETSGADIVGVGYWMRVLPASGGVRSP